MNYTLHDVSWTNEKVSRFWNFENNRVNQENWFTFQVGDGIWNFTNKFLKATKNTKILDYGAGKGLLSKIILEKTPAVVDCTEFSGDGLKNIVLNLGGYPNFGKAILIEALPCEILENSYDIIFFTEAIEHLTEEYFLSTLNEFSRILKPGGTVVITTPNDEELELSNVCCPDCGAIFHRMQHMRSLNKISLSSLMEGIGFSTEYCDAINFWHFKDKIKFSTKIFNFLLYKVLRKRIKQPHLVYIGIKPKYK